jgi:hypothetical protein
MKFGKGFSWIMDHTPASVTLVSSPYSRLDQAFIARNLI